MRRTDQQRRNISAGTRRALAAKRARGERVGEVAFGWRVATVGEPDRIEPDPHEVRALKRILELHEVGLGPQAIAEQLTREGHRPRGRRWWPESICRWLKRELTCDA